MALFSAARGQAVAALRGLLATPNTCHVMYVARKRRRHTLLTSTGFWHRPCCADAFSARLIEKVRDKEGRKDGTND